MKAKILAVSLVIFNILDLAISTALINMGMDEANPIMDSLIGTPAAWFLKIAVTIFAAAVLVAYSEVNWQRSIQILSGLNIGMLAVLGLLGTSWLFLR